MKNLNMSRRICIVLFISLFVAVSAFAEDLSNLDIKIPVFKSVTFYAVEAGEETVIPHGIANNEFFLESLRLTRLALETYDYGDYDASAGFAEEAIRFAEMSDEYVSTQLIAEAKRLLAWADENNIASRFPNNYNEGKDQYEAAVVYHSDEEWTDSIESSIRSIEIFSAFAGSQVVTRTASTTTTTSSSSTASGLPRQYTVRTWRVERDCLWNIAGYSWVYGDPWKWRELYEANKSKLPDPNNPDLIEPGMVLDIPSLQGEGRQGMWSPNTRETGERRTPIQRERP